MAPLLLAGGLLLASLPAVLRRLGRRLGPTEWARLCLTALVSGASLVELGAVLWAAPTLLRVMGVPALAMACDRLLGPLLPLGAAGGTLAGVVAIGLPILAWRGGRLSQVQTDALAIEPALGQHHHREDYDLVVVPTTHPLAYSLAGPAPQVVVSEGLCDSLTDAQVDAVIAHEAAHLSHRHPDLLFRASVAAASLAWWPLTGRSHRVLRNAFERWADEAATQGDHGRRIALREAIVATVMSDQPTPVAALSLADATVERVAAMDEPLSAPLPLRLSLYLPGAAAAVVVVVAGLTWMSQAQLVLAMAGRCTV